MPRPLPTPERLRTLLLVGLGKHRLPVNLTAVYPMVCPARARDYRQTLYELEAEGLAKHERRDGYHGRPSERWLLTAAGRDLARQAATESTEKG